MADQRRIMAVHLLERHLVQFGFRPEEILLRGFETGKDPDARATHGEIGQQRMFILSDFLHACVQRLGGQVVEVGQAEVRPSADVRPLFAALKAHGHGKTRASGLFAGGLVLPALLPAIAVLGGVVGQGGIGPDKIDNGVQGRFGGAFVCIPLEDVQDSFLRHGLKL